jgi:hypothetical protein
VVFIPKKDSDSGWFLPALSSAVLAASSGWLAVVFFHIADGDLFSWFPFGRSVHLPGFVIVAFFGVLTLVFAGFFTVLVYLTISAALADRRQRRKR